MNVHSATCSCSIELYKQWYTLADFLPNCDISRGFLYVCIIYIAGRISAAVHDGRGHYIFRVSRSSFRVRGSSVVYCTA
jgi:hypothetical protein